MMTKNKVSEIFLYMLIIVIILYVIWYVLTHSSVVTVSDLFTMFGAVIAVIGIVAGITINYVRDRIIEINTNLDSLKNKVEEMINKFSYIKGRLNEKRK